MPNRLAKTSSPYLRQHADNPVHWQPWDAIALQQARDGDTPILLSIGYSACHWCHVMAHESFENAATARVMNALYVNIKLDREERPDLDRVYQLAHQALSGRGGGWPLTVFLDPQDLTPFFAGTYFPPTPRHGLPAFADVLQRVRAYFDAHRSELRAQNAQLRGWLARMGEVQPGDLPDSTIVELALQRIATRFDPDYGGSSGAPKFPHAGELELLLEAAMSAAPAAEQAAPMAQLTLTAMAARGLQDHLGGGFFRYCVDAAWTIPHFEKMLYDNAQLLPLYARAARTFADPACAQAARGIVDWLQGEMLAPDGAFCAALDADSDAGGGRLEEGAFYVWTREQVRALLTDDEFAAAAIGFGLDAPPNFEGHAWHLLKAATLDQIAQTLGRPADAVRALLASARGKLCDARARRPHPTRDDKLLTAWNALTIAGLARAARALDADCRDACMALAEHALDALRADTWIDGALYANVAATDARIRGFLDDHALLLDALLEMLQARWRGADLRWTIAIADALLERFEDRERGGFFFSADEHATPLQRSKNFNDDSLPNGNGVAASAMLRLGHLLGETKYLDAAGRALRAASAMLREHPDACPTLLRALHEFHAPRMQVVIRCRENEANAWRDASAAAGASTHTADVFVIPTGTRGLPGLLAQRKSHKGGIAYVCEGLSCRAPVASPEDLAQALRGR